MGYEAIRYEIRDAVATIALNRPEAYNALNLTLGRDLFHATLEADEDRAVRCIVITERARPSARAAMSRTSTTARIASASSSRS